MTVTTVLLLMFGSFAALGVAIALVLGAAQLAFAAACAAAGVAIGTAWALLLRLVLAPAVIAIRWGWAVLIALVGAATIHVLLQHRPSLPESLQAAIPFAVAIAVAVAGMLIEFWARSWIAVLTFARGALPLGVGVLWFGNRFGEHPWSYWLLAFLVAVMGPQLAIIVFRRRASTLARRRRRIEEIPSVTASF